MPRRPRIKLADIPQHLVQRGVNREPCFFAEEDCHCYLHWLQEAADDWRCDIHAYVLMTNHVHLLVTPGTADAPARLMQSLGRRYVQYINRHYKRSGTLWEGRYKSSAVQAEDFLLACQRYIELNPVRTDIRLAIAQGQPLGNERFKEAVCAATGVRRAQPRRGRPPGTDAESAARADQTDFGF